MVETEGGGNQVRAPTCNLKGRSSPRRPPPVRSNFSFIYIGINTEYQRISFVNYHYVNWPKYVRWTVRTKDGRIVEDRALGIYPNSVYALYGPFKWPNFF